MGFLSGKNIFIEGYFARVMYRSLYKMHLMALHGPWKVALGTVARTLTRHTEPSSSCTGAGRQSRGRDKD
jgi:NADH dehydrogenase